MLVHFGAGVKVASVAAGDHHCLAVTSAGDVHAWGSNSCGQAGTGGSSSPAAPTNQPACVAGPSSGSSALVAREPMAAVAAGAYHSAALSRSGWLVTWGCGLLGQTGQGSTSNSLQPTPVAALGGVPLDSLACGASHTVVAGAGAVYAMGWAAALGSACNRLTPELLEDAALADEHVVKVRGPVRSRAPLPPGGVLRLVQCPWSRSPMQVACGSRHTIMLAASGAVLGCGWNGYRQLGRGDSEQAAVGRLSLPAGCVAKDVHAGSWWTLVAV